MSDQVGARFRVHIRVHRMWRRCGRQWITSRRPRLVHNYPQLILESSPVLHRVVPRLWGPPGLSFGPDTGSDNGPHVRSLRARPTARTTPRTDANSAGSDRGADGGGVDAVPEASSGPSRGLPRSDHEARWVYLRSLCFPTRPTRSVPAGTLAPAGSDPYQSATKSRPNGRGTRGGVTGEVPRRS